VWKRHWKLTREPFFGATSYVSTRSHDEAVARLVDTIETGGRRATVRASVGLGKSSVLMRALAVTRGPSRRQARVVSPSDGAGLFVGLAEGLGLRVADGLGRSSSWKALCDAVRLCRAQGLQMVLAIDGSQSLVDPADRLDLERLSHLDSHPEVRLSVLDVGRPSADEPATTPWELVIRVAPLTRGDAERYVVAKLSAAGRDEPTFTPHALHRLHTWSEGTPSGLDRLASLALMAGAWRGVEIITPDIIDGVAQECTRRPDWHARGVLC
jgi:MSHA biogenesis protein MshM